VGVGGERRGENRLRDGVARGACEPGAIARRDGVDGVAEWPQDIALHEVILTDAALRGQIGAIRSVPGTDRTK
jgi:hypothetical protein